MTRSRFHFIVISLLAVSLGGWPLISHGQEGTPSPSPTTALQSIQRLTFNEVDKADWLDENNDSQLHDRRILFELAPYLKDNAATTGISSLIFDRLRRGYDTDETKISRKTSGATNVSPHYYGKAATVSAIGTTSCIDEVLFPRSINNQKPVWVHWQTGEQHNNVTEWPFGWGFDSVARQFFWLEARAITNHPITSLTWSNFLQQLAKAEIEERFDLPAGSLSNIAVSDLPNTIARLRLASQLGLADLPAATTEPIFYEALGRREVEQNLNLPVGSLTSQKSWRDVYKTIGLRVMEEQLSLPQPSAESLITAPADQIVTAESDRVKQVAARFKARAELYQDPRLAFNLPPEAYIPSTGEDSIVTQLSAGQPEAFATVGAYFLTESLGLTTGEAAKFVQDIQSGQEAVIPLSSAHLTDPRYQLKNYFSADSSPANQADIFETVGREQEETIKSHLARINESVLRSIQSDNTTPSLNEIISLITDSSRRVTSLSELANYSSEDANYPDGITIEALRQRGVVLLADALDLDPTLVQKLDSDTDNADVTETAQIIDTAMGWPNGTTRDFARRQGSEVSPTTALVQEKQLLTIGSTNLWTKLGLEQSTQDKLHSLFFGGVSPVDQTVPISPPEPETRPTPSPSPASDGNDDDEFVELDIPASQQDLATELQQQIGLPPEEVATVLSGQLRPLIYKGTISRLASILAIDSTLTPQKFLEALSKPEASALASIADQGLQLTSPSFVMPNFFNRLQEIAKSGDLYRVQELFQAEAVHQWNFNCPNKTVQAQQAIEQLVRVLVGLPGQDDSNSEGLPPRPVQILTYDTSNFDSDLTDEIEAAYPGADGKDNRQGVYGSLERSYDSVTIGY